MERVMSENLFLLSQLVLVLVGTLSALYGLFNKVKQDRKLVGRLETFSILTTSLLVDLVFIIFWVAIQWLVNKAVETFNFSEIIGQASTQVVQIIFAITTILPIILYIYVDVRTQILSLRKRINNEADDKVNE